MCEGWTSRMKFKIHAKRQTFQMKCYVLRDHLEKAAWPGVFGKQKAQGLITSLSTFYLGDM